MLSRKTFTARDEMRPVSVLMIDPSLPGVLLSAEARSGDPSAQEVTKSAKKIRKNGD